jgi:hypothetical protein
MNITIELVHIQATENKKNTNSCTAANCHRRNYEAYTFFAVVGEEKHQ